LKLKKRLCCLAVAFLLLSGFAGATEIEPNEGSQPHDETCENSHAGEESGQPYDGESNEQTTTEEPGQSGDGSPVINVVVPLNIDFVIDPFEIAGRGQVYSDTHKITNYGDTDVLLIISDVSVAFAQESDIRPLAQPFTGGFSDRSKSIFLLLDFGRPDAQPPAVATAPIDNDILIMLYAQCNLMHEQEDADEQETEGVVEVNRSQSALSISGNVNPYPASEWAAGDVKITVTYRLEAVVEPQPEVEEEEDLEEQEPEEPELEEGQEPEEQDQEESEEPDETQTSPTEPGTDTGQPPTEDHEPEDTPPGDDVGEPDDTPPDDDNGESDEPQEQE